MDGKRNPESRIKYMTKWKKSHKSGEDPTEHSHGIHALIQDPDSYLKSLAVRNDQVFLHPHPIPYLSLRPPMLLIFKKGILVSHKSLAPLHLDTSIYMNLVLGTQLYPKRRAVVLLSSLERSRLCSFPFASHFS